MPRYKRYRAFQSSSGEEELCSSDSSFYNPTEKSINNYDIPACLPVRKSLLAKFKTSSAAPSASTAPPAKKPRVEIDASLINGVSAPMSSAAAQSLLPVDPQTTNLTTTTTTPENIINNSNANVETIDTKEEEETPQKDKTEDNIRAYCEVIDMFELIVKKLWVRGKERKSATPVTESQLLLSSVEKDLMMKMAARLNQLAADL